jgi:hypothetical protein
MTAPPAAGTDTHVFTAPLYVGFEVALAGRGYSADSIGRHLRLMVHLSRWLAGRGLTAQDLTAGCARRFVLPAGAGLCASSVDGGHVTAA